MEEAMEVARSRERTTDRGVVGFLQACPQDINKSQGQEQITRTRWQDQDLTTAVPGDGESNDWQ